MTSSTTPLNPLLSHPRVRISPAVHPPAWPLSFALPPACSFPSPWTAHCSQPHCASASLPSWPQRLPRMVRVLTIRDAGSPKLSRVHRRHWRPRVGARGGPGEGWAAAQMLFPWGWPRSGDRQVGTKGSQRFARRVEPPPWGTPRIFSSPNLA